MVRGDPCLSLFFLSQHFIQISVHVSTYVITTKIIIITNMKYLQFILVYRHIALLAILDFTCSSCFVIVNLTYFRPSSDSVRRAEIEIVLCIFLLFKITSQRCI